MVREIRKFIVQLLGFIVFSSTIYFLLLCAWGELFPRAYRQNLLYPIADYGHMFSRLQDLDTIRSVDVLILGSSHAYRGLDTRIFSKKGIKTFNLGSNGQTPLQAKYLLKKYLPKLKPKLVLYEVYLVQMIIDGVECSLDIIANDDFDWSYAKMAWQTDHPKTYHAVLYDIYREGFGRNHTVKEAVYKREDTYIQGGYVQKDMAYNPLEKRELQKLVWIEKQFKALKENIAEIEALGIDVILYQAPITSSRYRSFANRTEYDSIISGFGKYYNFNGQVSLNDSLDFYDAHHLNHSGVEKFTHHFLQLLEKEGVFEN